MDDQEKEGKDSYKDMLDEAKNQKEYGNQMVKDNKLKEAELFYDVGIKVLKTA